MHSALLRLVTSIGKLDTHPYIEELKQILASHASFIQRIYKDIACLQLRVRHSSSAQQHDQNQQQHLQ